MTDDHRSTQRQRTLKGARIVINNGHSTFQCTVRNLSEAGALLRMASIVGIPESFDLVLDDGRKFAATVVRRSETELGVRFSQ